MKNKRGLGTTQIFSIIIVVVVIMLVIFFMFFKSGFLDTIKLLPSFGGNQIDTTKVSEIVTPSTSNDCEFFAGKLVAPLEKNSNINYGKNFVSGKTNICGVLLMPGICKFSGIYLDEDGQTIRMSGSWIKKDIDNFIIGKIEGNKVLINSEIFDENSNFRRKLTISSYDSGDANFNQNFNNYISVLDDSNLIKVDQWLCKSKEEYANNGKDDGGNDKLKLGWPESENIKIMTLGFKDLGTPKISGKYLLINLPDYLNPTKSEIIRMSKNGLIEARGNSWYSFMPGWRYSSIMIITLDRKIWINGDYLTINENILKSNGVEVRKDQGINFAGYFDKGKYILSDGFNNNNYYETNIRIDQSYFNILMSGF